MSVRLRTAATGLLVLVTGLSGSEDIHPPGANAATDRHATAHAVVARGEDAADSHAQEAAAPGGGEHDHAHEDAAGSHAQEAAAPGVGEHGHAHEDAAGGHAQEAAAPGVGEHGHAHEDTAGSHAQEAAAPGDSEHGQAAPAVVSRTHFTGLSELFVELPPLVVGHEVVLIAHLTRLDDYRPVSTGRLAVRLTGDGAPPEHFSVDAPDSPGIFRLRLRPAHTGQRRLGFVLEDPAGRLEHDLGVIEVHARREDLPRAAPMASADTITLFKEQQWQLEFGTVEVALHPLRAHVKATGSLQVPADARHLVVAPVEGLVAETPRIPVPGTRVEAGAAIAALMPRVAGAVDIDSLELEARRSRALLELARRERQRLEGLVAQRAAAERSLVEARSAEGVAGAELESAERRLARYRRSMGSDDKGPVSVSVRAPHRGRVTAVQVIPGQIVQGGAVLLEIVREGRLWLEVQVPEAELPRADAPQGAAFRVRGIDASLEVSLARGDRLLAAAAAVDPITRTAPVLFELAQPDPRLRAGMWAEVSLWIAEAREVLAVPASAIVREAGVPVVYVMIDGEHFERRVVRPGLRDGDFVEVLAGLTAGERIVHRGAYYVRLAGTAPASTGHGHAH